MVQINHGDGFDHIQEIMGVRLHSTLLFLSHARDSQNHQARFWLMECESDSIQDTEFHT